MQSLINREEDYALRIIIYLATVGKMVKTKEICENLFLSRPIVLKIVNKLKSSGFLITKTGKEGGLTVTEKVYDASLYEILHSIGFSSRINQCLYPETGCQLMCICKVNTLFNEIQIEIEEKLKNAKIKEFLFIDNKQKLVSFN